MVCPSWIWEQMTASAGSAALHCSTVFLFFVFFQKNISLLWEDDGIFFPIPVSKPYVMVPLTTLGSPSQPPALTPFALPFLWELGHKILQGRKVEGGVSVV